MSVGLPKLRVGDPLRYEALSVFPLFSESSSEVEYRLSDAALADKSLLIEEISEGGSVTNARILRSVPLLDQAALNAVRQWQFTPTLLNGVPVPVIMSVTVNFTLR